MPYIRLFRLGSAALFALSAGAASIARAQDACPAFIADALATAGETCGELSRDQACYVSGSVEFESLNAELAFAEPGDLAALDDLDSLSTSPLDLDAETWGVALLQVGASLPGEDDAVTLALFGEVEIADQAPEGMMLEAEVVTSANVRTAPQPNAPIIALADVGDTLELVGRLNNMSWFQTLTPSGPAWVYSPLIISESDLSALPVVEPGAPAPLGVYQSFSLRTTVTQPACIGAPLDGLLMQAPPEVLEVIFIINGVEINLRSTAFVQADEAELRVYALDERSIVRAGDTTRIVQAGDYTVVPLTDGVASGRPAEPEAFTPDDLGPLPLLLLPTLLDPAQP